MDLRLGQRLAGPALVIEPHQTVVVEPGWSLEVSPRDDLVLRRTTPRKRERLGKTADPVLLEVFNNLFMSIAEQMGEALRNTAQSVNIKERLDFSCAVFDAKGELVANAPHMPVHLGSMDRSVETVIRGNAGKMRPGDVYMLNAPYNGGTHLPDITVITPVFAPSHRASRDSPPHRAEGASSTRRGEGLGVGVVTREGAAVPPPGAHAEGVSSTRRHPPRKGEGTPTAGRGNSSSAGRGKSSSTSPAAATTRTSAG